MDASATTEPPGLKPDPWLTAGRVLRDIVVIWVLTFVGGFIIGITIGGDSPHYAAALAISNLVLGAIGFAISGYLAPNRRWMHLLIVALGTWLTSLLNLLMGFSLLQWFGGGIAVVLMMAFGGGLSYFFKRN